MAKDFIPIRYVVCWHPTDEIEAECIKQGMKPDDGTSFWDWVDIFDHEKQVTFSEFAKAVEFSRSVAKLDCFGGARIYRQLQVVHKDDKGAFIRWEDECFWDGITGDDNPDESKPDEWADAA